MPSTVSFTVKDWLKGKFMDKEEKGLFEKHFQTLLFTLMAGLLGWGAFTLTELKTVAAASQVEMTSMKENVKVIRVQLDNQYTKEQAYRFEQRTARDIEELKARIRALEARR